MFDQTLLPEEDFSGGKLLRHRKTSTESDLPPKKRRKTTPTALSPNTPITDEYDQIEVSRRPRSPQRATSQPPIASQPKPPSQRPVLSNAPQREFRVRDRTIDYTIPSLKSLLPPQPRQRQSSAPAVVPKIRSQLQATPGSPKSIGRSRLSRIGTRRDGQKMLLMKLHISPAKLAPLVRKPQIRIVESASGRKRQITEVEDEEPAEHKRNTEKPFGGILTKDDADTSKTTPTEIDRSRFERARENIIVFAIFSVLSNRSVPHILLLRLQGQLRKFLQVLVVMLLQPKQHSKYVLSILATFE